MVFEYGEACERCAAVPWKAWYRSESSDYGEITFTGTAEQLQSSPCPICRVIGCDIADSDSSTFRLRNAGSHLIFDSISSSWRSVFKLYDKDDEAFLRAWRTYPTRVDFVLAKRWIRDCITTHEHTCKPPLDAALKDLKVLDCHDRTVVAAPEHCAYVALSYVWGKAGVEDAPHFPRLPDVLPRTVEDSIRATQLLGYRYLWIDRYCIDQNNAASQQHQINQMGVIYSSSRITIIAAVGEDDADANYGLPGITNDFQAPISCAVSDRIRLVRTKWSMSIADSIVWSSWYSRGWTFQEGYLSRRRMYFTDVGVEYICDYIRHGETFHKIRASLRGPDWTPADTDYIPQMMHVYTGRHLTHDHDALNAIVGALETRKAYDHIWGVSCRKNTWVMLIDLHWRHQSPVPRRRQFPSWSPVGWRGQVDYHGRSPVAISTECSLEVWRDDRYQPIAQVYGKLSQQHYLSGAEESRFFKVTTKIVMLEFVHLKMSKVTQCRRGLHARIPYSRSLDLFVLASWDSEDKIAINPITRKIKLPCAVIVRKTEKGLKEDVRPRFEDEIQVLILQQHKSYYERIGCFAWNEHDDDIFEEDDIRIYTATRHALNKKGVSVPIEEWRAQGDGRYWLKDGDKTTFLLG